ncbi:polyketide synthase [Ophiostoma piceae UAMH 11346]|uniref:Polyketide synthase n=1 Tax=Ophiostoma piceae (strain UAMH 11346) TaxID=1262450 RepID=S3CFC4_OPHP1|nr:polyketide synthase [Ophiostoma piceae UAMH 11346]
MADPVQPVAIVGLGGRFPGKATDPLKLWEMCSDGEDAWSEVPSTRFNHKAFYHPDQSRNGATNVKGGFYLKDDVSYFDAPFFNMTKTEAASLDPQQRLLLECSYEALENAGMTLDEINGSDMGVFVGSFCFDWAKITLRDADAIPLYHATGTGQAMLANRLSYFFNLHGPSVTLDTACSSSLVALHQACQALRAGECETALVAGVNCTLCQDSLASMSTMGFLSPEGRSYTYDSRATGYGRGEGVACVVLKRLDLALESGDAVRAIVRNTGVNQDGRTPGITFPSGEAQAALIRRVYDQAGLELADTSYVEAHGTGTQAGDPIEARALHNTFGVSRPNDGSAPPLVVGCIKTNIGHLEGASGAAGLIKTVMMLERETILPNCDFREANAKIPLDEWRLAVPTQLQSWRAASGGATVLRASVNGFGYGGTNAHVIVESAADYLRERGLTGGNYKLHQGHTYKTAQITTTSTATDSGSSSSSNEETVHTPPPSIPSTPHSEKVIPEPISAPDAQELSLDTPADATPTTIPVPADDHNSAVEPDANLSLPVPKLFVLSAQDEATGKVQIAQLQSYLAQDAHDPTLRHNATFLNDLAHTLNSRRSALPWKAAVPATSAESLRAALSQTRFHNASRPATVGYVFTGQGAQWYAMGRELATTNAVFRASLDRSAAILASSTMKADWSLHDELLRRDANTTRVNEPAVSQSLCTVLQVALVDMLRSWGIKPAAVVGHSSGEIGAAYAAGLLSQEAAVAAAYFRVPLDSSAADSCRGGMMALACDEETTLRLLDSLETGKATIACYNSPQSFTVSGDDSAIDELSAKCKEQGLRHRKLVVGFAYHSHKMTAAAAGYRELLLANRTIVEAFSKPTLEAGSVEMYSSVTGKKLEPGALSLDYWVDNLVNPVRFTEALTALCYEAQTGQTILDPSFTTRKPQVDILVEIGPHAALAGPIRQILQSQAPLTKIGILGMLRRGQDATETSQLLACQLFEKGLPLDVTTLNADCRTEDLDLSLVAAAVPLVDLPPYPWNHATAYWAEPVESIRYRQREHARHDLLGAPVRFGSPLEPRWRQWIRTAETPWVRDHRVQGLVVYPAAGYISMAIEAARQNALHKAGPAGSKEAAAAAIEIDGYELRDVTLGQALIVPEGSEEVEAMISLRPQTESAMDNSTVWHEFFVYSCSTSATTTTPMGAPITDNWSEHCRGRIAVRWKPRSDVAETSLVTDTAGIRAETARRDAANRAQIIDACHTNVNLEALYDHCTAIGLEYGPTFANLVAAKSAPSTSSADPVNRILGTVTIPDVAATMPAHCHSPIVVHPGTLDACLHGIMSFRDLLKAAIMPVFFENIYISAAMGEVATGENLGVYLGVQRSGFRNLQIDLTAYGPEAHKPELDARSESLPAPLIRMEGLRMTSLAGSMPSGSDGDLPPKTYYEASWKSDPVFLSSEHFEKLCAHLVPAEAESAGLRRLEQSAYYMADYAVSQVPEVAIPNLTNKGRKLYKSLLRLRNSVLVLRDERVAQRAAAGLTDLEAPHADDIPTWPNASPAQRAALLGQLTETGAEGRLLAAVSASMHGIILGTEDPLEVTMKNDVLGQYYAHNPRMLRQYQQAAVYADLLAHKNPHMRILEIGAGTGGATIPLLRALGGDADGKNTSPRFSSYDVTDISSGFFEAFREKVHAWQHLINFKRLDVEKDPSRQGFTPGTYDLVIAANVLHATRNIGNTVAHARQLLRPGGTLMLIELVRVPEQKVATAAVGNMFGIFDGWWIAEEEHRQDSPLLAETQWDAVLRENGFSGLDAAVWETPDLATHQGTTMISTAIYQPTVEEKPTDITAEASASTETIVEPAKTDIKAEHAAVAAIPARLPPAVLVTDSAVNKPWLQSLAKALSVLDSSAPGYPIYTNDDELPPIAAGTICVFFQSEASTVGIQTPESMEKLRRLFLRSAEGSGGSVLWLTTGATDGDNAPDFALVQGLLRTLRVELGGRLIHLDLDMEIPVDSATVFESVVRVFERSFAAKNLPDVDNEDHRAPNTEPELELAIRGANSTVYIPRYDENLVVGNYVASRTGRRNIVPASPVQPGRHLKLEIGQPGMLDSLYFDDDKTATSNPPLGASQVEISVRAAGLNFHDVMVAMGQIETRDLGRECAGVITQIGSQVTGLKVGDRVAAPADGTIATTVRFDAWRAQRLPDSLSFEAGASLPIILCTALHTMNLTNLTEGETVLIHAASGGLGQALIQLCQERGAIIYATVGTAEKKQFLVDQYGLDPSHIFSSRDDSFASAVMQATDNEGVDVVFNVLASELLRASWRCVASFGRFVELGKRDLTRNGRLDMGQFTRNVTFVAVDLVALMAEKPKYSAQLWAQCMDLVRKGVARAPTPLTSYGYADAHTAMHTMQVGRHIGKLVLVPESQPITKTTTTKRQTVTEGEDGTSVTSTTVTKTEAAPGAYTLATRVMLPQVAPVTLRADASYLLIGGLGGIGRALSARMVKELGARYLIILTRGGVNNEIAAASVAALRAHGASVLVCNCDVGREEQLAAALKTAKENGYPPVRGAVNLSLVMESALFQDMSSESWNNSLWPKVPGSWNLHNALSGNEIDFFILVSSMVGTIGNPSQTAYGSASTFQDAFAKWRRRRGLAGMSIDLGMIADIGYVAEHGSVQQTLLSQGFEEIDGPECLAILEAAMLTPDETDPKWKPANLVTGLGLGRYTGGDPTRAVYTDPRFRLCRRMAMTTGGDDDAPAADGDATQSIREMLRQATSLADVISTLETAIRSKITALLMLPAEDELDTQKPLSQYGLDSLIAVELRNWVNSEMEATVPVLEFLGSRNIQSLSGFIARQSRLVRKELVSE